MTRNRHFCSVAIVFFRSGCIPQELSDYNVYMSWLLKCLTNVSSFIISVLTLVQIIQSTGMLKKS